MDRACAAITSIRPCKNNPNLDTGGQEKTRKAKGDVEKNSGKKVETSRSKIEVLRDVRNSNGP